MKYIAIVWIVIIAGALGWASISLVSSLFQDSEPVAEAVNRDEGVLEVGRRTNDLLKNSPGRGYRSKSTTEAKVVRVLDGDTIEVDIRGELVIVGYIGLEAPDVDYTPIGAGSYGEESFKRNKEIVEGKTVLLEKDFVDLDRDGRSLRYVYIDDVMVNAVLLYEGLARTSSYAGGLKYAEIIYNLQSEAMTARKGGWRNEWPNIVRTR